MVVVVAVVYAAYIVAMLSWNNPPKLNDTQTEVFRVVGLTLALTMAGALVRIQDLVDKVLGKK